jgi:hypothetical protein
MKHVKILLLILFGVLFFKEVFSQDLTIFDYQQLKGLKKLTVTGLSISIFGEEEYGITKDSIRYYAEGRLRDAGIEINKDIEVAKECPFLTINLNIQHNAYSISLELHDKARLARDPSISIYAIIWRYDSFHSFPPKPKDMDDPLYWDDFNKKLTEETIKNTIAYSFDAFLKAYHKANPEK